MLRVFASTLALAAIVLHAGASAAPASNLIAFSHGTRGGERYDIWVTRPDGTGRRRVTHSPSWDWWPAWSPDGSKIAFSRSRKADFDIYVVDASGRGLRRLTGGGGQHTWPTWSPDGMRIAFAVVSGGDRSKTEIYVANLNGPGTRRVTRNHVEDGSPAWSPDGRWIAFTSRRGGRAGIYVVHPDGTGRRFVVRGGEAAWSPDGRKLAFARKVRQEPEPEVDEIFVVNVDGSRERQLTRFGLISHRPSWSADGRKIVFVSNEPHRLQGTSIWVMSASGGGAHRISRARYEDADPDWHP